MQIYLKHTSIMRTNTYVAANSGRAFIVDPGADPEGIKKIIDANGLNPEAILLTHAHFDHIGAVKALTEIYPDIKVVMHLDEVDYITSVKNLSSYMHRSVVPFTPDVLIRGGETLNVCGVDVRVYHTPGHSIGGVCYEADGALFSGDTLFRMTYGRTDLYDGSFAQLKNSIVNKLFNIDGDLRVLPGHGDESTLDFEKRNNPIRIDTEDAK